MKHVIVIATLILSLARCSNELVFEDQSFHKKTSMPCIKTCSHIDIQVPIAKDFPIVADSINKKVFFSCKEIIDFGEKPIAASTYPELVDTFIHAYEKIQQQNPKDDLVWEAEIKGSLKYHSEGILNIEIKYYTDTGGAHGYQGLRSLLFDPESGKTIAISKIFKDIKQFTAFAENEFRLKFKIPLHQPINATGFQFDSEKFELPQNIFYTDKGLLLYYNPYEVASYSDGPKELLLPYEVLNEYLLVK